MTKASLNLSGKTPLSSGRLMMLVIGVRRTSRHSLMMKVGQDSKSQDLVGDLDMSYPASSSVNGRKERNGRGVEFSLTSPSDT